MTESSRNSTSNDVIMIKGKPSQFFPERAIKHFKEMGRKSEECKERGGHIPSGRFVDTRDVHRVTEYCAHCGFEYERHRQTGDPRSYPTYEDLQREVIWTNFN